MEYQQTKYRQQTFSTGSSDRDAQPGLEEFCVQDRLMNLQFEDFEKASFTQRIALNQNIFDSISPCTIAYKKRFNGVRRE